MYVYMLNEQYVHYVYMLQDSTCMCTCYKNSTACVHVTRTVHACVQVTRTVQIVYMLQQ